MLEQEANNTAFDEAFDEFAAENSDALDVVGSEPVEDTTADANITDDEKSTDEPVLEEETVPAVSQPTVEEALEQARQWEMKFKSLSGRVRSEVERRREEDFVRQQQMLQIMANVKKEETVQEKTISYPDKFKAFMTEFPEFAEPVLELLNSRLEETKNLVGNIVDERVKPLATTIQQQHALSHIERIKAAHPDAIDLKASGTLDSWINTLPVFMKKSANYILEDGSTEDVIALLDQYKSTINTNKNKTKNTDKPTETVSSNSSSQEEKILNAVRSGLAVKGSPSGNPNTSAKMDDPNDEDAGWNKAMRDFGFAK